MSSSYSVEYAKSGRSKCKKCKLPIAKDAIRIVTQVDHDDDTTRGFSTSTSHHSTCFSLPRRYATGAAQISALEFVNSILEDKSSNAGGGGKDKILPTQAESLAEDIESSSNSKKGGGGKAKQQQQQSAEDSPLAGWKRMFEEHADSTTTTVPRTKKAKLNTVDDAQAVVEWYGKYHKLKNEQLKDVLRWNRQVMTPPTKEALLYKAIDGALYGRLARCALCGGGRLKITFPDISKAKSTPPPGGALVVCSGSFDEDTQRRIDCAFSCAPSAAPRLQPWYGTVEPTESEQEEMDRIDLAAKNGGDGSNDKNDGSSSSVKAEKGDMEEDDVAKLQRAASALEWNLSSRDGMREAAAAIVKLFSQHSGPRTIDLPAAVINVEDDDNDTTSGENAAALQKIGPTIAANRTKSASELIPILVALFGFKEEKQAKADRKQAALTTIVACPDNAPLVAAFVELSDLYFKTGNANAGISYKKVVGALAALKMPVTTDNAKGLGGGKTKVPNIGKSSAEKILEFVTTGTMEKLEEKRIEAS